MTADIINHPPHYTSRPARCTCGRPIECIDVTRHMGFNLGNACKYIWRSDLKGAALDDLRKAVWYLQDEIAKREAANRLPDEGISFADHIARRQAGLDAIIREAEAAGLYDIAAAPLGSAEDLADLDRRRKEAGFPQVGEVWFIKGYGEVTITEVTTMGNIFAECHLGRPMAFTPEFTLANGRRINAAPRIAPENGLPASDLGGVAAKDQTAFWAQNNGGEA